MHTIYPLKHITCVIKPPPDKSISHRAILFSALAKGKTVIDNFLHSQDTITTLRCLQKLGVKVKWSPEKKRVIVYGTGKYFPRKKRARLSAAESGTTIRILSGILSGQKIASVIDAAPSLRRRPMKRIIEPLSSMGACIRGRRISRQEYPPLHIRPVADLHGICYHMPISSAQVKSALIFASLYAQGTTRIVDPGCCRDHTERMMRLFKGGIATQGNQTICHASDLVTPGLITIPGDISSASFFIALGLLLPESKLTLINIGINPTRAGIIDVLKQMGGSITLSHKKNISEPSANIHVKTSRLKGIHIKACQIPTLIDEIPILTVCAAFANGTTRIDGVGELRVKETDRIASMITNLTQAGVEAKAQRYKGDWRITIRGLGEKTEREKIRSVAFKSFSDHRTAMSLVVFGLASGKKHSLDDTRCINKSFPGFMYLMRRLKKENNLCV